MHYSAYWRKDEFYYCKACYERKTERPANSDQCNPKTGYNKIWRGGSEPYTAGDLIANGRGFVSFDFAGADICVLLVQCVVAAVSGALRPSYRNQ